MVAAESVSDITRSRDWPGSAVSFDRSAAQWVATAALPPLPQMNTVRPAAWASTRAQAICSTTA